MKIIFYGWRTGMTCLVLSLTACGTTGVSTSTGTTGSTASSAAALEAALPLVRTGAAVATGAVLDFAVKQSSTRTRLANEMYAAANAVYSLSGGTFPAPAQFEEGILAFGGTQADANYAQFSTAIAGLYAAYYPKLATGDAKTATDLLNAIAGGIEDATAAYVTTPVVTVEVEVVAPPPLVPKLHLGTSFILREIPFRGDSAPLLDGKFGNEVAQTSAFPNGVWERGDFLTSPLSF